MTDHHGHHGHDQGAKAPVAGLAKDPVCGMNVDPHTAKHRASHQGRPYYFCSAGCRTKFIANPETYLARDKKPVAAAVATSTGN